MLICNVFILVLFSFAAWNLDCLSNSRYNICSLNLATRKNLLPNVYAYIKCLEGSNSYGGRCVVFGSRRALHATRDAIANVTSTDNAVYYAHRLLVEEGIATPNFKVDSIPRLDYNKEAILETLPAAIEADEELTRNNLDERNETAFYRFDGDEGIERRLMAVQNVEEGTELIILPREFSISLSTIIEDILSTLTNLKSTSKDGSFAMVYINHIEKLCKLSIGTSTFQGDIRKWFDNTTDSVQTTIHSCTGKDSYNADQANNSFELRLEAYAAVRRLQLLKTLIIADSILSIGDALSTVLDCKEMSLAHINRNEKEVLLLSLSMAVEYYLAMVSAVLRMIHDPSSISVLSPSVNTKLLCIHSYLTKEMGHIPMFFPEPALKQIQEPTLRHRLRQRHLAVKDVFTLASDPLGIIQDRIEYLAQAHYKIEDSMPANSGCGPLLVTRKIQAEAALEEMEAELLQFKNEHDSDNLSGLLEVNRKAILEILGEESDSLTTTKQERQSLDLLGFFEEYLTGNLNNERYRNFTLDDWVSALNSIMAHEFCTKLFAATVAHNVRPRENEPYDVLKDYTIRSFLNNGAPGIRAETKGDIKYETSNTVSEAHVLPVMDLCNHNYSEANAIIEVNNDRGTFVLRAIRNIKPGEEITLNYGNVDNNVLMLDYGFISRLKHDEGVLMEIEPSFIAKAAASRGLAHLLPTYFPAGLPPEKRHLLRKINMIDIPSDKSFLRLYNEPYFYGMPVEKFNEFNAKFMTREDAKHPLINTELDTYAMKQERSEYQPVTNEAFETDEKDKVDPLKLVRVQANGIPDERLIPVIKICFCKTKKRLDWIAHQDLHYLSTSVNSPLDLEVFRVASLVCCEYVKLRHQRHIIDDLRQLYNSELVRTTATMSDRSLSAVRQSTSIDIPNALLLAYALRAKMPLYKCATYFENIASTFERGIGT